MSLQTALDFAFEFGDRPIQVEVSQSLLSSDAGLLIFRQRDERLRYTEQFADALWGDSAGQPTVVNLSVPESIIDSLVLRQH